MARESKPESVHFTDSHAGKTATYIKSNQKVPERTKGKRHAYHQGDYDYPPPTLKLQSHLEEMSQRGAGGMT